MSARRLITLSFLISILLLTTFEFLNEDNYIEVIGKVVHHGSNEDGMEIMFKEIEDKDKEFIRMFVGDYL